MVFTVFQERKELAPVTHEGILAPVLTSLAEAFSSQVHFRDFDYIMIAQELFDDVCRSRLSGGAEFQVEPCGPCSLPAPWFGPFHNLDF
jgi:hypothetical protein